MAVVLVTAAQTYTGTSADPKPVDASILVGARFTELDTGLVFLWSGAQWITAPTLAEPKHGEDLAASAALLDELVKIRRLLEEANGLDASDLIL